MSTILLKIWPLTPQYKWTGRQTDRQTDRQQTNYTQNAHLVDDDEDDCLLAVVVGVAAQGLGRGAVLAVP